MSESPRLFYALWPDENVRAGLADLQMRIKGRRTAYGNLHLTLAFLGERPISALPLLKDILQTLPRRGFTMAIDRIGYFPHRRIVWAGMKEMPPPLHRLRHHLLSRLSAHAIACDDGREFRPHITLARSAEMPPDSPFDGIVWHARTAVLVQSISGPSGVTYRPLDSVQLFLPEENGPRFDSQ